MQSPKDIMPLQSKIKDQKVTFYGQHEHKSAIKKDATQGGERSIFLEGGYGNL